MFLIKLLTERPHALSIGVSIYNTVVIFLFIRIFVKYFIQ